ncbi:hypothetical protein, partial [Chlorobium sp.]|uniref:hypothetical protein n=1 Tax=Chlorobium sp. TaxID=1095 RepID=UPI003C447E98
MKILTYWFIAIAIGLIFFRKETFSYNTCFDLRRKVLLAASVVIVALNAFVYSNSTYDSGRTIDWPSVILFTFGNGIAETFMFYAFFSMGEKLADKMSSDACQLIPKQTSFIVGILFFMVYSGLIHGLFWLDILPEHVNQASPFKPLFMPTQLLIAGSWALSFFWYRDLPTVFL